MKKLVKLTMLAVLAVVGCGKSTDSLEGTPITIAGEIAPMTKATEAGFEKSDAFSAYISENATFGTDVKHENLKYSKSDAGWSTTETLYWRDKDQKIWIWGIYPYQSTTQTSPMPFTVEQDQSSRESETKLSGYENSDLLLAYKANVAATETAITLSFQHALSKINMEIESGEFDVTTGVVVKISNVKRSSTVDLSTYAVSVDDGSTGIVTACHSNNKEKNAFFKAIVQPGEVADLIFSVEVGGKLFEKSFGAKTFTQGKQHNFKLTLKNSSMTISGGSIGPWIDETPTNDEIKPF